MFKIRAEYTGSASKHKQPQKLAKYGQRAHFKRQGKSKKAMNEN